MKKAITVIILFTILIGFGFFEVTKVRYTLTSIEDIISDLNLQFEQNEDDITIFYDEVGDVKEFWEEKEGWLCFLFNHRDLSVITDSINKLRAYTKNNDFDNAIAEFAVLKEYSSKSYHIMGFNIHNIL